MAGITVPEVPTNGAGANAVLSEDSQKRTINPRSSHERSKPAAKKVAKKRPKKVGRAASKMFPTVSFEEALTISEAIQAQAGGTGKIRRLTLFDALNKSPDSGSSRMLITNSSRYGLTAGGYAAEYLELTQKGNVATNPEADTKAKLRARFDLAINAIPPFKALYERFNRNKLPAKAVMHDALREAGVPNEDVAECADAFIVNAKYLGLLKTIAGAERLISIDHALDELPSNGKVVDFPTIPRSKSPGAPDGSAETSDWSKICFYITPIGDEGSEQRRHSDLFLNYVVEPAIEGLGLKIIRADAIGKSGMIGPQIVEHVLRSRLVIVDLSFHNPNVFYELCLRHVSGLPTVHIIRQKDPIPFDIQQCRTIQVDTTDVFTLVPKLDVHKAEIAQQARQALENETQTAENPITVYFPGLRLNIPELPPGKRSSEKVV
jgi:hypothetical protein